MKSFEEIYEIFKNQLQIEYTLWNLDRKTGFYNDGELESGIIHVTEAVMGLARVRVKDNLEEYRLVPAWIFKGNTEYKSSVGDYTDEIVQTLVIVNAVDGSIINADKGY